MADAIPLVDFSKFAIGVDAASVDHGQLSLLGEEICKAFTQIGFCYIYNHGIPQDTIQDAIKVSKQFFEHSTTTKEKYARPIDSNGGWVATEREKLNPERPAGDLKEAYNYFPADDVKKMPIDIVPNFKTSLDKLYDGTKELSYRVFDAMSLAMKLPSKHFLRDTHRFIGIQRKNASTIRTLYYPSVTKDLKPGQVRCGEHSDYGSLTFLFQDNIGGLEVQNSEGTYIPATPVEGAIVVNIGDLMQRWTADKMKATKHRVLIPEAELKRNQGRQSMAFFLHPDDEVIIKCLDGSDKYEPISSIDYLNMRFSVTY